MPSAADLPARVSGVLAVLFLVFNQSRAAYDKAIELAGNTAETASLTRRRDQLS